MKCKTCTKSGAYEVIGLCDIKKFNNTMQSYKDKAWTYFSVLETITLPKNKLAIDKVDKVYIKAKITSNKIVDTVRAEDPNIEGIIITGKSVNVNGYLCGTVIYSSSISTGDVHSVKYQISFSTKITVDENTSSEDIFCIYPCIENVSARVLSSSSILIETSLFVYAHKSYKKMVEPIFLQGIFVFYNLSNNIMATVQFDSSNRMLIVESTNENYGGRDSQIAFNFELYNIYGTHKKAQEVIVANDNADSFSITLTGVPFRAFDIINIMFLDNTKVKLSGYPDTTDTYEIIGGDKQSFIITPTGITPYILKEIIAVLDENASNIVATIEFDIFNKQILVNNVGIGVGGTTTDVFFRMNVLLNRTTPPITASSRILENNNGIQFKSYYNGMIFQWNDLITLEYKKPSSIKIYNYPNPFDEYIPTTNRESYFLTVNGFVRKNP